MLGSIIHNVHVVARSWRRWGPDRWTPWRRSAPAETVIIRSHGERKEVFDRLERLGAVCVNATCPNVLRIQRAGGAGRPGGAYPPYHWGASASGGHGCGQLVGSQRHLSGAGRT
ncbi:MAG: hypothetical protein ACLU38_09155 [Dysosmobacter sp.]